MHPKRLSAREIEASMPPSEETAYRAWSRDARKPPHWHAGQAAQYYHRSSVWGMLLSGGRWGWMVRSGAKWWTEGAKTPLLWHARHWWWRQQDGWFLLHDGQAWAYRVFSDLKRDGLIQPDSKVQVIYSEDAKRFAVVIPGQPTVVYDVATGEEVGRVDAKK